MKVKMNNISIKKCRKLICYLFLTFFCTLFLTPNLVLAQNEVVRVGVFQLNGFFVKDSYGNFTGYGIEYLQELSMYNGWKYEFVEAPLNECLKMLELGEIDLLIPLQRSAERDLIFDFSNEQFGTGQSVLVTRPFEETINFEDFERFNGMKVGVIKGNQHNVLFDTYCSDNDFAIEQIVYDTQSTLTAALEQGDIDAMLQASVRNLSNCKIIAYLPKIATYIATTKGNHRIIEGADYALRQISLNNPSMEPALYSKYFQAFENVTPSFTKDELLYIREKKTITCLYNPNWASIEYIDPETGSNKGISFDVFHLLETLTGLKFDFYNLDAYKNHSIEEAIETPDLITAIIHDYNWGGLQQSAVIQFISGTSDCGCFP